MNDNIIAERKLQRKMNDGTVREICVRLGLPYLDARYEHGKWKCRIQITDPDEPVEQIISGVDAIDAMESAIKIVNITLDSMKRNYVGRISWLMADELPDGGPLRSGALYGDQSWQLKRRT